MNNIFFITIPSEIPCNLCNLFYSSKWFLLSKAAIIVDFLRIHRLHEYFGLPI
jgi:hypothetical protein